MKQITIGACYFFYLYKNHSLKASSLLLFKVTLPTCDWNIHGVHDGLDYCNVRRIHDVLDYCMSVMAIMAEKTDFFDVSDCFDTSEILLAPKKVPPLTISPRTLQLVPCPCPSGSTTLI